MALKTETHVGQSKRFQDEIEKLKGESASSLEALKSKHNGDLENIKKKQADSETLRAGDEKKVQETLQHLEKEKQKAVDAAKKEMQTLMDNSQTQMRNEKEAALDEVKKEKDDSYKSLKEMYETLKKELSDLTLADATLATDSKALAAEKISLTTELSEKKSAYNTLQAQYDTLKKERDSLTTQLSEKNSANSILKGQYDTLQKDRDSLVVKGTTLAGEVTTLKEEKAKLEQTVQLDVGAKSKMEKVMSWAGLSANSRMDNCLPYSYSGWTVMIMMPHSRMALNANNGISSDLHCILTGTDLLQAITVWHTPGPSTWTTMMRSSNSRKPTAILIHLGRLPTRRLAVSNLTALRSIDTYLLSKIYFYSSMDPRIGRSVAGQTVIPTSSVRQLIGSLVEDLLIPTQHGCEYDFVEILYKR